MTNAQIIVLATPVFLLLIAGEWLLARRRPGLAQPDLRDAVASVSLGMFSQLAGLLALGLTLGLYTRSFEALALRPWALDSPLAWAGALLLYDGLYYWKHRAGHRVALLWAAHAVHHQSEHYNLSTALRQTGTDWVAGWLFTLPLAVLGVPPLMLAGVAMVDLLYQFWVHTGLVGRLGWFDRWFCSPSNHRVHHAVNEAYLDRNYGGILMLWDHLFGTFTDERDDTPCVYGTRSPLLSHSPWAANLQVYGQLWAEMRATPGWGDRLRVWFKPPGWRAPALAARQPRPPFVLQQLARFEPAPVQPARLAAALLLFGLLLGAETVLLWQAHQLATGVLLLGSGLLLAGLCGVAALGRPGPAHAAGLGSAAG